jgi:hypothetical protein
VALKMLSLPLAMHERSLWRFQREARQLAQLEHHGIERVNDAGTADGVPWYAMELVEGASLARVLDCPDVDFLMSPPMYLHRELGGTSTFMSATESVKLHVDSLRRCAAEQQAREPGAHGTLKMAWTIQQDGSPRDVRCLTPALAQGAFAQCITGVVKGVRYPRIGDPKGQAVTFPFGY